MTKVLVVDDEKLIVKGIRFSLEQDNMEVDCAYDGEEAMSKAKEKEYDVILLDVMLPKADGFEVLQTVREFSEVPVIMLTAKSNDMDKILGLEYGADDYITKPFNILEVKARIKAILRRNSMRNRKSEEPKKQVIVAGSLKLDRDGRRVFVNEKEINLTARNSICWSCWFAIQTKCTAVRRFLLMCGAIKLWIPAMYVRLMCMSGGCGRRSNQVQVHRSLCIPSGGSAIILLQNRQHLE